MLTTETALLTSSRLKTARACRRLHKLKYLLGYVPAIEAVALRFGTLIHLGLEAWWLAKKAGLPQEDWLPAALAALSGEADPFDLARAQVLLAGYHLRWKDEPYEVLAVEVRFECSLRNPETGRISRTWRLAGKIDVIVRDLNDGLVRVVEHKTSSEQIGPGSDYWKRLRLDGQVSMYFEGAASLGFDVAECLYDILGKPALRPLEANSRRTEPETPDQFRERVGAAVAEDPARYFQRGSVVRLEEEKREALTDAWQIGQQLHEEERLDIAPRNPDACVRFNQTCAFFDVCTGSASLEDETRFRRSVIHPELASEVSERAEQSNQEAVK